MNSKLYNNVKTVVLLAGLSALIMAIGGMMGGMRGVSMAFIFALVMNFVGYFFSDRIAIASMRAVEVGPEHPLFGIIEPLAVRAKLPMPRVFISPQQAPNAFATGRNPKNASVCATEGLLRMLSRDEIAGVMAHELAHVKHRDILIQTVAATIAAAIGFVGHMFMFSGGRDSEGRSNPIGPLLTILVAPIAAGLIQAGISRSREFNADKEGAEIAGDPMHLATALEKIHMAAHQIPMNVDPAFNSLFIAEPRNFLGTLANLYATHPPLEQRLMNLIGRERTGMFRQ